MSKTLSAVDWLANQFKMQNKITQNDIEIAQGIFERQIINAHNDGHNYYEKNGLDAEQYYKTTYETNP